ncbi:MAG TPA: hypothetical protein VGM06_14925 [Polyangiaceae bacterium]
MCAGALVLAACGSVPVDSGGRLYPAAGVIRGTVSYQGPRPCSQNGHIVGSAVLLVFDRRNPPPPDGAAATAPNFVAVTGDVLFANEPRFTGADMYCPAAAGFTQAIAATAPFEVAPLAGASYEIRAFYDSTGNFLPEFSIRNLPERGDIAGGAIDTADALKPVNAGNPDYQPLFLPIDVGVAQPLAAEAPAGAIPVFAIPDSGFVADNVAVTIAAPLPTTRPYFYAQGEDVEFDVGQGGIPTAVVQSSDGPATNANGIAGALETDPNLAPVLTIPQDIAVFAPPAAPTPQSLNHFESAFPHLRLAWGVPSGELAAATVAPFGMQVAPFVPPGAGLLVFQDATLDPATQTYVGAQIPEGGGVPQLWPQVVLERVPDPGAAGPEPTVLIQGITLAGSTGADSLLATVAASLAGQLFDAAHGMPIVAVQDHVTVMLRPSAICLPASGPPGTLVTPYLTGTAADVDCSSPPCVSTGALNQPLVSPSLLGNPAVAALVDAVAPPSCLPLGRYAINVVYPDGQAWTVPNEAGVCSGNEGATDYAGLTCTLQPRPVLYSQGARAVVEVVAPSDPTYCVDHPVPAACATSQ